MARPLIMMAGVVKTAGLDRPLRIRSLDVAATDRLVLRGLDSAAAELFVHLVTGAVLPDEGVVRIDGRDTREIGTDTAWLASLDRFGLVTSRAVLLDGMSVAANLALPLTLAIDPLAAEVRARVEQEAIAVGFDAGVLDRQVGALTEAERVRLHLARAVIAGPALVLLEHPTSHLTDPAARAALGSTLQTLSAARGFGWMALSDDDTFASASGGHELTVDPASGLVAPHRRGWRFWQP